MFSETTAVLFLSDSIILRAPAGPIEFPVYSIVNENTVCAIFLSFQRTP